MENARIARQRRRMIMNEKRNQGGIIVGSGSRSKKVRKYNDVQPTDSTTQSMTNNRNEMENERLHNIKDRKQIEELLMLVVEVALAKLGITTACNQQMRLLKVRQNVDSTIAQTEKIFQVNDLTKFI
jgi:protein subunit release factor A